MEQLIYQNYVALLKQELVVAMGCTEPIAVAYAGAKAREILGKAPERCLVRCSGNIIKNVKGVVVPHSGGRRGIDVAAILGIVGGDPARELDVLHSVTDEDVAQTEMLLKQNFCACQLVEGNGNLYIDLIVTAGSETAEVEIQDYHTNITTISKNGRAVMQASGTGSIRNVAPDKSLLNLKNIFEFANGVDLKEVCAPIEQQIRYNEAVSQEGLLHPWGACVGRTLLQTHRADDLKSRACAAAAAGSDARMAGCALPVVINSGSGNQGITVTLPILVYAEDYGVESDKVYRALCLANLISLHLKKYIGSLSAYCGVVSAACASACGIAYMLGDGYGVIAKTVTNTICTVGGMVCDGAKSSCAAKIATAVNTALTAWQMARMEYVFQPGEGLVGDDVEDTISNVGRMGREGMGATDLEILHIMLGQ